MTRLCQASLSRLPVAVERPRYDRAAVKTGIVHLGLGAFHRAHQAIYVDDVLAAGDPRWGIVAASLRSPDTRDALAPQDGLYTVVVRDAAEQLRVIGSVTRVLVAPEDPGALVAAMADSDVKIVTLTITEKGYCYDPATRVLLEGHPDIVHDLVHRGSPRSAIGFLAAALLRRRDAGIPPFAVLCCDNLPANGETVKRVLTRYCDLLDPELGRFVASEVAFPSSMVDRIVPATTDEDRAQIAAALGVADAWPVITEPFCQWVIEDKFPLGRPDFAAVGAELVKDVHPFELMKLRLLNGSHSMMAYLGYLAGCETIADAIGTADIARFVDGYWAESIPTLPAGAGLDPVTYTAKLRTRFGNTTLKHRTWQIAMDGSQKLPQRWLGTLRQRIAAGAPYDHIALGIAAWMSYVTGIDEKGEPIDVRDPLAGELRAITDAAGRNAERLAPALLGVETIFGDDLPSDAKLRAAVTAALAGLFKDGTAATLARFGRG